MEEEKRKGRVRSVRYDEKEGAVVLLDQTLLPWREEYVSCSTVEHVFTAIRSMKVRGAPAIGLTAAFGLCALLKKHPTDVERLKKAVTYLKTSRPTAVNLAWALDRAETVALAVPTGQSMYTAALTCAKAIESEDVAINRAIGRLGASLLVHTQLQPLRWTCTDCEHERQGTGKEGGETPQENPSSSVEKPGASQGDDGPSGAGQSGPQQEGKQRSATSQMACVRCGRWAGVVVKPTRGLSTLTRRDKGMLRVIHHCNTGRLATVDHGTALGVIYSLQEADPCPLQVFVQETRPRLQGARLTAWELQNAEIDYRVMVDSAGASLMRGGGVNGLVFGADRVAMNGDVANKIGTYPSALAAHANGVPVVCCVPTPTIDPRMVEGAEIEVEQRGAQEVLCATGASLMDGKVHTVQLAPPNARAYNPAFDVTPAHLLTAIVTEVGVCLPPFSKSLPKVLGQ